MGAEEVVIPIFVVPLGLFVTYHIWQWHVNHLLAIEALRLVALRDRGEAAAQADAHAQDIEAALEEIDEANEALEEVLAGAGGRGTRDSGVGSGSPL